MKMRLGYVAKFVATFSVLLLLSGCGGEGPDTQYVEGIVTLDGTPIEGVAVGFSPTSEGGVAAFGTTDASGVYKLTAQQGGEAGAGTVEGTYNVSFIKTETAGASGGSGEDAEHESAAEESSGGLSAAPTVTHVVPQAYNDATKSGFTVTVKAGTNKGDEFNFDLKSDFTAQ